MNIPISHLYQQPRQSQQSEIVRLPQTNGYFGRFVAQLINLVDNLKLPKLFLSDLEIANDLLESLPISTTEYDLAQNRLKNAMRYVESSEPGAAKYELRMLISTFKAMVRDG